jgi:ABC-type multidrug transport system fused ATPase/permease subunit
MQDLSRLLSYTRKYWRLLLLTMASLVGITAMNLVAPWYIRKMTAILMDPGDGARGALVQIALILIGSYVLRLLFRFAYSYLSHVASWNVVATLRATVYSHLQKLSLSYYHDKQTGQLMSRVINDTAVLEQLVAHSIPDIVTNVLIFAGVTVLLMFINIKLTLLTMIPMPLIFVMLRVFSKKIRPFFTQAQEKLADLNATLQDSISGMREIQAFNQQAREEQKVYQKALAHAKTILKALLLSAFFHPSIEFVTALGTVIVVFFGGVLVLQKSMSVADIVGFLMYLSMFYAPIAVLARVAEEYQQAVAGAKRIFEVLDIEPDVKDAPGAVDLGRVKGGVRFEGVGFSYDADTPVLEDISFEAKPGTMVAIVGPTGVGKTTLISLLARFYDPTAGRVEIDGTDIRNAKLESLHENVSMVLQDVFLFNGTIAENIAYGLREAPRAEIERAAKIACIHDYISSLPEGYDTFVGERGVRLSGGQKQRISIARAVLRDSPILVLDEATAAVDVETEVEIQNAIQNLVGSRTVFVIAHRLSTVRRADRIMVLSEGRLVESGTHEELVRADGIYARYYDTNLRK